MSKCCLGEERVGATSSLINARFGGKLCVMEILLHEVITELIVNAHKDINLISQPSVKQEKREEKNLPDRFIALQRLDYVSS